MTPPKIAISKAQIIPSIIIAGIIAMDHLTINTTIDPKGILMSVITMFWSLLAPIIYPEELGFSFIREVSWISEDEVLVDCDVPQ
jgi:hypothetical protein